METRTRGENQKIDGIKLSENATDLRAFLPCLVMNCPRMDPHTSRHQSHALALRRSASKSQFFAILDPSTGFSLLEPPVSCNNSTTSARIETLKKPKLILETCPASLNYSTKVQDKYLKRYFCTQPLLASSKSMGAIASKNPGCS